MAYRAVAAFKLGKHSVVLLGVAVKKAKLFLVLGMSVEIKVQIPYGKAQSHYSAHAAVHIHHLQHPIKKGLSRQGKIVPRQSAFSLE